VIQPERVIKGVQFAVVEDADPVGQLADVYGESG